MSATGERVGRYVLGALLGRGRQGAVYRAADEHGVAVAVKLLAPELASSEEQRERFHREARAASRLRHPNIVTLLDVGETSEGVPFLVVELVDGVALDRRLLRGPLRVERAWSLVHDAAAALEHAHARGIVHRDVKPSNILLAPSGAKLIDFGLAWATGERSLTADGTTLGTPAYVAPEQVAGEAGPPADVYALGCVVFETLAARPPFVGNAIEVVRGHLRAPAPRLASLVPDVDPALDALVSRMLEKPALARPSPAELVSAAARS